MPPILVLLPGLDGTGDLFSPFVSSLSPDIDTVVIRYPADNRFDYPALTSLVKSQLPNGKPFALLAESFSGPIAISLAATDPKDLVGLVLCATFAQNPRPRLRHMLPLSNVCPTNWIPKSILTYSLLGRFATNELHELLKQAMRKMDKVLIRQRLQAIADVDVIDQLERIRVPSLYLLASEDRLVPSTAANVFERLIPNCQIVRITGPHLLLQAAPVDAVVTVKRFLETLK